MTASFARMWAAHPAIRRLESPCTDDAGESCFGNQYATKLGVALQRAGIDLSAFPKTKCFWFGYPEKHVLRAEKLATWMKSRPVIFGKVERIRFASVHSFRGRQAIVLCRNFWKKRMQGDHLDLWNGSGFADGQPDYFERSLEVWFRERA
jgi:hypothetical protein